MFLNGSSSPTSADPFLSQAINEIRAMGHIVSVEAKAKSLLKFGYNPNVGTDATRHTVWYTGKYDAHETYADQNVNPIDSISSSNASDTEVMSVEGHTETDGNKTFVVQTPTLDGQNRVALSTPLNRVTRIKHAQQSATNLAGEIYCYQNTTISSGKPVDTTKIHLTIPAGENQSQKCSTSLSSTDYWIVTKISAGYLEKSGTNFADVRLEKRPSGGVFVPVSRGVTISTGREDDKKFAPYEIIAPNSDVRLTALASATSQAINGDIDGYLAKIIGTA